MTLEEFMEIEPGAKVAGDRVAYLSPLTLGRWRLNLTRAGDLMSVDDFY